MSEKSTMVNVTRNILLLSYQQNMSSRSLKHSTETEIPQESVTPQQTHSAYTYIVHNTLQNQANNLILNQQATLFSLLILLTIILDLQICDNTHAHIFKGIGSPHPTINSHIINKLLTQQSKHVKLDLSSKSNLLLKNY